MIESLTPWTHFPSTSSTCHALLSDVFNFHSCPPVLLIPTKERPGKKRYVKSHMHLDQFSVELVIDGKEIISDPGSYIYTPAPLERWKYRSNEAHFSSMVDVDIENWKKLDPFGAVTLKPAYPSYFGLRGFFSSVGGDLEYGRYCLISIRDNEIKLYGFAQDHNHPDKRFIGNKISDGYGSISNNLSFATVDED